MVTNSRGRGRGRPVVARGLLVLSAVAVPALAQGCGAPDESHGEELRVNASEAPATAALRIALVAPDAWEAAATSPDAAERAGAADAIAAMPAPRGTRVLRELAEDPDARVRARAVLAYGQAAGRDALPLLKHTALTDADPEVQHLALAAFNVVKDRSPEPPRSWMKAEVPNGPAVDAPYDVQVRFGSSEDAPTVKLYVHPPANTEIVSPEGGRWVGPVKAGVEQTATFTLRARSATAARGEVLLRAYVSHDIVDLDEVVTVASPSGKGGQ